MMTPSGNSSKKSIRGGNGNNKSRRSARARTILAAVIVANIALLLGVQFYVLLGASKAVVSTTTTPSGTQRRRGGGHSAVRTSNGASPSALAALPSSHRAGGGSRGGTGVGDAAGSAIANATSDGSIVANATPTTTLTTTLSYHRWEIESISSLVRGIGLGHGNASDTDTKVIAAGRCVPPIGGASRSFCCIGSTSRGGGAKFRPESAECALGHTDAYERVRLAAEGELNRFPLRLLRRRPVVPSPPPSGDAPDDGGSSTTSEECDACRIVDVARRRNWTIGFTGDSVHRQVFDGFLCELLRNGYAHRSIKKGRRRQDDWRHGIRFIHAVSIDAPAERTTATGRGGGAAVTARFFQQYRPHPSMTEMSQIANISDVLLFNFGVHWRFPDERDDYSSAMTDVLSTLKRKEGGFEFLGYRETAAQHFRSAGGEYPHGEGRRAEGCAEGAEEGSGDDEGVGVYGWRERIVRGSAEGLGFDVLASDETLFPPHRRYRYGDGAGRDELLVVPFLDYTRGLGYLHKIGGGDVGDCTHYCSTPFLWAPLWRSVRLGVEYRDARLRTAAATAE